MFHDVRILHHVIQFLNDRPDRVNSSDPPDLKSRVSMKEVYYVLNACFKIHDNLFLVTLKPDGGFRAWSIVGASFLIFMIEVCTYVQMVEIVRTEYLKLN